MRIQHCMSAEKDQVFKRRMQTTWKTLVKALKDHRVNQIGVAERIEMNKLNVTKQLLTTSSVFALLLSVEVIALSLA